jgi:hypothetical protein
VEWTSHVGLRPESAVSRLDRVGACGSGVGSLIDWRCRAWHEVA